MPVFVVSKLRPTNRCLRETTAYRSAHSPMVGWLSDVYQANKSKALTPTTRQARPLARRRTGVEQGEDRQSEEIVVGEPIDRPLHFRALLRPPVSGIVVR